VIRAVGDHVVGEALHGGGGGADFLPQAFDALMDLVLIVAELAAKRGFDVAQVLDGRFRKGQLFERGKVPAKQLQFRWVHVYRVLRRRGEGSGEALDGGSIQLLQPVHLGRGLEQRNHKYLSIGFGGI